MKKILSVMMISIFVFAAAPTVSVYAEDLVYQENVIDKISDWAKTVGKDKTERDRILAERKATRQAKHAEKKAEKMKKNAEKKAKEMKEDAGKAGKDMKKKMGL